MIRHQDVLADPNRSLLRRQLTKVHEQSVKVSVREQRSPCGSTNGHEEYWTRRREDRLQPSEPYWNFVHLVGRHCVSTLSSIQSPETPPTRRAGLQRLK